MKSSLNKLVVIAINIFFCTLLSANEDFVNNSQNIQSNDVQKVNSIEDYKNLESLLLKAYKAGDESKSFALGGLYLTEYKFTNGESVKSNVSKAMLYLNKALNSGFGLAAIPLLKTLEGKKNALDDSFLLLEEGIMGKHTTLIGKTILAVSYNSLILDHKFNDLNYVHKALDLTYMISQQTNKSSLDFTIANLLYLAGNKKEANKYLNTACNNPNVDEAIKKSCNESIGIKNNLHASKTCKTCGVLK